MTSRTNLEENMEEPWDRDVRLDRKTVLAHLGSKRSPESIIRISESVSKLKPADVLRIQELLASGIPGNRIAKDFGVCKQTISNIRRGRCHKHVRREEASNGR